MYTCLVKHDNELQSLSYTSTLHTYKMKIEANPEHNAVFQWLENLLVSYNPERQALSHLSEWSLKIKVETGKSISVQHLFSEYFFFSKLSTGQFRPSFLARCRIRGLSCFSPLSFRVTIFNG